MGRGSGRVQGSGRIPGGETPITAPDPIPVIFVMKLPESAPSPKKSPNPRPVRFGERFGERFGSGRGGCDGFLFSPPDELKPKTQKRENARRPFGGETLASAPPSSSCADHNQAPPPGFCRAAAAVIQAATLYLSIPGNSQHGRRRSSAEQRRQEKCSRHQGKGLQSPPPCFPSLQILRTKEKDAAAAPRAFLGRRRLPILGRIPASSPVFGRGELPQCFDVELAKEHHQQVKGTVFFISELRSEGFINWVF
ncbi:hypothetical protein Droror1_Dr00023882 [Drosera rotundifolia]